MGYSITRNIVLNEIVCCACDITFAVPDYWLTRRTQDGKTFYCPNGHGQSFTEPENERLRRQLKSAQARATHANDQRQAAERSARAYKGQVTKIKKRVGNGVCPCCQRSFQNLGRHMANQHPGYADGEEAATDA